MLHDLKITPIDRVGHYAVAMDGKQIDGVTDVQIAMSVDSVPTVWLGIMVNSVDAELINADVVKGDVTSIVKPEMEGDV